MLDEVQGTFDVGGEVVQFLAAGTAARGSFQCADCGYGVSVQASLPQCPMCAGTSWEPVLRSGIPDTIPWPELP